MRAAVGGLAAFAAGCAPIAERVLDPAPEGARSALVVTAFADQGGVVRVVAQDHPEIATQLLQIPRHAKVWALFYDRSLAQLGLSSGPVVVEGSGRRLPAALEWRCLSCSAPERGADLPPQLTAVRIRDVRPCLGGIGEQVPLSDPRRVALRADGKVDGRSPAVRFMVPIQPKPGRSHAALVAAEDGYLVRVDATIFGPTAESEVERVLPELTPTSTLELPPADGFARGDGVVLVYWTGRVVELDRDLRIASDTTSSANGDRFAAAPADQPAELFAVDFPSLNASGGLVPPASIFHHTADGWRALGWGGLPPPEPTGLLGSCTNGANQQAMAWMAPGRAAVISYNSEIRGLTVTEGRLTATVGGVDPEYCKRILLPGATRAIFGGHFNPLIGPRVWERSSGGWQVRAQLPPLDILAANETADGLLLLSGYGNGAVTAFDLDEAPAEISERPRTCTASLLGSVRIGAILRFPDRGDGEVFLAGGEHEPDRPPPGSPFVSASVRWFRVGPRVR